MKKEQRLNPDIFSKESIWKLMVKMVSASGYHHSDHGHL